MNKERFWPRAAGAVAIIALVLVTNECYRHARALVDDVNNSKWEIASLKRELYVLQVQLDTSPTTRSVVRETTTPPPAVLPPLPMPIGAPPLSLPEAPSRPRTKIQASEEPKSLVSVVLMSDAKAATPGATGRGAKPADVPTVDVKLLGESK